MRLPGKTAQSLLFTLCVSKNVSVTSEGWHGWMESTSKKSPISPCQAFWSPTEIQSKFFSPFWTVHSSNLRISSCHYEFRGNFLNARFDFQLSVSWSSQNVEAVTEKQVANSNEDSCFFFFHFLSISCGCFPDRLGNIQSYWNPTEWHL